MKPFRVLFASLAIIAGLIPSGAQAQISWVVVDSMGNAFGVATNSVKPFHHDPPSSILRFIHRGHPGYASSGSLWLSTSSNSGISWVREGPLNTITSNPGYPTGAIHNPTLSSSLQDLHFVWAGPLTTGIAFGVWGNISRDTLIQPNTWATPHMWTESRWVFFAARRNSPDLDFMLWRTRDYVTFLSSVPSTWSASNFSILGLGIGGTSRNSISYFGAWGVWPGEPGAVYNIGYSRSLDSGNTWSVWYRPPPDWRSVPGIAGTIYDDWWSYGGPGSYSFEMLVDANNRVHFFGVVEDTSTRARAVVEIYETGTGWAGKIITPDLKPNTRLTYGDLIQMGNQLNAAINSDGTVMALAWLDGPSMADTLPDIWFSNRHIASANWSSPQNITQTPNSAELLLHSTPILRANGNNSYTMFLVRNYETRLTTYPPNNVNSTSIFFGTHTFNTVVSVSGSDEMPGKFSLEQNYPNPFNPATVIRYQLPVNSFVRLNVYDVLGREVATLVNEVKEPGSHTVTWDASRQGGIPSGIYFYRLMAGTQIEIKKAVLMK